ncbi:DUF4397 domain-containing protein [Flavobacterium sp. NRK F10]|uniref:DUF4397 domain-containing protein n=1 Tax=Flavobacterium sp. NRK F10 TaxID=2954931 RepID=UPI0020908A71|nr:DUF4397 domain-containing protein [Flavobacterium sp. NRK F10]MCO6174044.1 DUF4397 domain-containing protein [Flavobacterium sp. NRK F10]
MKRIILKSMTLFFLGLTLVSCDNNDDVYYYYIENPDVAHGILVNASPNSGDLYFHADENQINSGAINYGTAVGYFNFSLGERLFSLLNTSGDTLASTEFVVEDHQVFGLFAVNTFNQIELFVDVEENVNPNSSHAAVRFINLSPDSQPITVSVSSGNVVTELGFKEVSGFIEFEDGEYDFTFSDTATGITLFSDTSMNLYGNRIYTVYTKGFVSPPSGSNDTFSTEYYWHY